MQTQPRLPPPSVRTGLGEPGTGQTGLLSHQILDGNHVQPGGSEWGSSLREAPCTLLKGMGLMQVRRGSLAQACLSGERSAKGGALDAWPGCREVWEQGLGLETEGHCQ